MAADHRILADASAPPVSVARATEALRASWPPLDERSVGGWRLGFSQGFTRRANSVWMLGEVPDARAAIGEVEEAYRARGLPSRFFATGSSSPSEVAALRAFGYVPALTGRILAAPAPAPAPGPAAETDETPLGGAPGGPLLASGVALTIGAELSPEWLDAWLRWNGRRLPIDQRLAPRILGAGCSDFLQVRVEGNLTALARLTLDRDIAVIDCLVTERGSRGRGYGRLLVDLARRAAAKRGAASCLAMVVERNAASLRLFERAGFRELGAFSYLEAPDRISCC
ncbi:GNAT family N-acetyltransferase [Pseudoclavibacter helvolus]|uniref:GNAT family N-acetyltransferase n=1 Tax=Pseudoclavibacter helvolus TaxID=255205 RepID=UPI003C74CF08